MKLKLIIIYGSLAAIGAVFYFQIGSSPQPKRDKYPKSASQDVSQGKTGEAGVYVDTGLTSLRKNDPKAAESAFKKALEIDPKYIRARAALATLYLAMGDQERGEQELILAAKSDPENQELLHILGTYESSTRRLDDYENLYRDLLKRKPDSIAGKKKLSEVLVVKGDLPRAWASTQEIWKVSPGDLDILYFYGRFHLTQNEYSRAAELFFQVTRERSRFAPAYYFLGRARLGSDDTRQAETAFAKAKELNPVWLAPRMALARLYLDRGAYDRALEESEPILQTQPRNFDILMIAGTARLKKGEAGPALDLFNRAKEVSPTDATPQIHMGEAYVVQKKYGQALTAYEEALKLDPDRIDALGSIAQILALQGNRKAGFERVQQQLAKTKNKAEVYQLLGQLSMDQQDYEQALSYLQKAVALKPDLFSAAHLIASTYMAQKKFDQAIAESEKIIQKNPRATQSYMLLGVLHDQKQQYDQANRYYKKVLELDKNSALAANNLAWNYAQYGGDLDVASTLAQKARELSPNDENIAHTLGWIYYKRGVYMRAIGLLKESSEKFKDRNPTVLYHLGMAYSKKGDNTLAKESLLKALKLDQNFPEAKEAKQALDQIGEKNVTASEAGVYVDTGLIGLRKNDPKVAEGAFRKALEVDPKYTRARAALAILYFAMGDQERGEQELILATKSDPENEDLLHILGTYGSRTRRLDDYENLYTELLKRKPDSLAVKKKLTELLIVKGEFREARRYVGEIRKARRNDIDAGYFDGRIFLAEKDYVVATDKLFLVTRETPRFAPGYYFLGQARLGTNDTRQAQVAFTQAKELNPVWLAPRLALARMYLAGGDYNLALEESEPMLQVQPRNVEILIIAGTARLKKGEAGPALELFNRAKEVSPTDATPQINMGAAYVVQKKYGQALAAYEEALKLDPDGTDALGSIAQVLAVQGNQKAGFERVQQQLAKTKNKAEVYQLLGQLSMDQQDYEQALSYLQKAVALKPDLFSAAHLIASTYMAQKKFDQAMAESEKIIQKNPRATRSYMLLGILHDQKQQYDQANRNYKKVLDLDKNSALAANNLAWNYAQYGGDLDAALTLAQKARGLSPNDENVAHTLGWIYYKRGVYSRAIGFLKESSEKFKDRNPTVLYHLGMAYSKKGDNTLAKESLSKALKLDQNFPEAKEAKQALDQIGAKTG